MVDPATISVVLTAAIVGIISITTGRSIFKDLYNSRFNSWGYRIIRFRPSDPEHSMLFGLLQSREVLSMSTVTSFVCDREVTTNLVKCRVAGAPCTVRCRLGIQQDGTIYFIVWDPPIFRRKYGIEFYRKMLNAYSGSSEIPLVPIGVSLLVKA